MPEHCRKSQPRSALNDSYCLVHNQDYIHGVGGEGRGGYNVQLFRRFELYVVTAYVITVKFHLLILALETYGSF